MSTTETAKGRNCGQGLLKKPSNKNRRVSGITGFREKMKLKRKAGGSGVAGHTLKMKSYSRDKGCFRETKTRLAQSSC